MFISRYVKFYESIFPYKLSKTHNEMKQGAVIDIRGSVECEPKPSPNEPQIEPEPEPIQPDNTQHIPTTFTQPPQR